MKIQMVNIKSRKVCTSEMEEKAQDKKIEIGLFNF